MVTNLSDIGQRARTQAEKEARLGAIMDAAAALYDAEGYGGLSMAGVAAEAGLAKGTLYLYFRTKEELFLGLIARDLEPWFAELSGFVDDQPPGAPLSTVAGFFPGSFAARPRLLSLLGLLHVVLEENVPEDRLLEFKAGLRDALDGLGARLEARFDLRPGDGAAFLMDVYALVIGFYNIGRPGPAVRRILDRPDMAVLRVDFERGLGRAIRRLAASYGGDGGTDIDQ